MNKKMATIALILPMIASASEMTIVEGKVSFNKGQYQINGVKLIGLSLSELSQYEGQTVEIIGVKTYEHLNINKVFLKTENGYEASFDWDMVNSELYEN